MIFIDRKTSASFFLILISVNIIPIGYAVNSYGQASFSGNQPFIDDRSLKADLVFQGLLNPTSMAFLGPNDILVLEKDQGTLQRIVNGHMLPQPVLHVNVATVGERGMLGIAIAKDPTANRTTTRFVFLYYTESKSGAHLGLTIVLFASGPLLASMQTYAQPRPVPYCKIHPFAPVCHPRPVPYCKIHPFAPVCHPRPVPYCKIHPFAPVCHPRPVPYCKIVIEYPYTNEENSYSNIF